MENFFDKELYEEIDIIQLMDDQIEEAINLEFKSADALRNTDKCKNELLKDISSFANSTGGIIIYGIEEKEHCAHSLTYIDGSQVTKEWIEQVINTRITRRIHDIQIYPIRFEKNLSQTVYLIKVPESYMAPHMAYDNKFYKRYNFQVIPMQEYEVRSLYFKTKLARLEVLKPEASIEPTILRVNESRNELVSFLKFKIENISYVTSDKCKLEILLPVNMNTSLNRSEEVNIDKYYVESKFDYRRYLVHYEKFIFPLDTETIFECYINLSKIEKKTYEKVYIYVNLFFDGGRRSRKFSLLEILDEIEKNKSMTFLRSDLDI